MFEHSSAKRFQRVIVVARLSVCITQEVCALGLVGPMSVYFDWVRQKVGSAASISVWQHVK